MPLTIGSLGSQGTKRRSVSTGQNAGWGKIFGTINTRRKFLDRRLEFAKREGAAKSNDSLECRSAMDLFEADDAQLGRGEVD
jgi:nitrate/TMAO reductase-like tetraheme cytochrome c subunit